MINKYLITLHVMLLSAHHFSLSMFTYIGCQKYRKCENLSIIKKINRAEREKKQMAEWSGHTNILLLCEKPWVEKTREHEIAQWNGNNKLLSLPQDISHQIYFQVDPKYTASLRLVCKIFAEKFILPETNGLHIYRVLDAICNKNYELLEELQSKEIKLWSYKWLSDFHPGYRLTKVDDLLYTSWKKMKTECACDDPYGNGLKNPERMSIIVFGPKFKDIKATLAIHGQKKTHSLSDKSFRLIAACLLGKHQQVKDIMIEYDKSKILSGIAKNAIIPSFAIAVSNNDIQTLSAFCSVAHNSQQQNKFLFPHMFLLNLALGKNKKEAFETLSSLVLQGKTSSFLVSLPLRIKLNQFWGELSASKKSVAEKEQDMYDFLTTNGFTVPLNENILQFAHYCKGNVQYSDIKCYSYEKYLSYMIGFINVDRKGRAWETDAELFKMQDDDLNKKINIPMLAAIKNNDLPYLENMLCSLEQNQYFYNQSLSLN